MLPSFCRTHVDLVPTRVSLWFFAVLAVLAAGIARSQERPQETSGGPRNGSTTGQARAVAAAVDRLIDARLQAAGITASPIADDAEFLRRVTLDLTGRIPRYDEAVEFLASDDPAKRSLLIDQLLARASYGNHFASIWRELIEPRDSGSTKVARDTFSPWLAEQFNRNRGWNEIVTDLLTVEGNIRDQPQSRFVLANSINFEPQPNLLADATARLFWGVQLRCAECHDHPFAPWKQTEFWGTAAFFSRLRKGYSDGKNPQGWTLTETPPDDPISRKFTTLMAAPDVPGAAIVVPDTGAKLADVVVTARFLGGGEAGWTDDGPFRGRFAEWATGPRNPYFAANAANRAWAHLFGRGLVNPLDEFHQDNPPSHPELLRLLADEFVASQFDLKQLLRVICNSQTYQRTSRPSPDNGGDEQWFSHMAVKVIPPGVLYDSLSIVLYPVAPKPGAKKQPPSDQINPLPDVAREEFVKFFAARPDENRASVVNQGIPQFLRLMNGLPLRDDASGLTRFRQAGASPPQVIEALYLAAYSRTPSAEELKWMTDYLSGQADPRQAQAGVLWALVNSAEFVLNH